MEHKRPTADIEPPIPSLNLRDQYAAIRDQVDSAVHRVLESQQFILGPEVDGLERELAAFVGCQHVVGVASGSDALLLSLMALNVGPGDEVITSPYTFFATAGAIGRLGAKPVFIDIDPQSYNIEPQGIADYLAGSHRLLNDHTRFEHDPRRVKAIIPVHLFGQCADMQPILELGSKYGLPVVEDAAQAIGATYQELPAASMGRMGCLSFFPSKNLGAAGDGGAIVTNDASIADKLRVLRAHGSKPKYFHSLIGLNSRLDAIQAAILRVKLPWLAGWTNSRIAAADRYDAMLGCEASTAKSVDDDFLVLPWRRPGDRHIFNQYVIRTGRRDELQSALKSKNISSEIYYPVPMHRQTCFSTLGYREGDLFHSEQAARETLALPIFPEISVEQQDRVARVVRKHLAREI